MMGLGVGTQSRNRNKTPGRSSCVMGTRTERSTSCLPSLGVLVEQPVPYRNRVCHNRLVEG